MKNKDLLLQKKDEIFQRMNEAARNDNSEDFTNAFSDLSDIISKEVLAEADERIKAAVGAHDDTIRAARGERILTSKEREYYNKLIEAYKAPDVKQALNDLEVTMPESIINSVFDDMKESSELLEAIDFIPTGGVQKFLQADDIQNMATWGPLTSAITEELTGSISEVNMTAVKLTAFVPVSQDMLELGAEWIDTYIRRLLTEALMAGLEDGIINGNGKHTPIGLIRQVGDDVDVKGGVYPEKTPVKLTAMDTDQIGNILAELCVNGKGKTRNLKKVIFVVNPVTYFKRVLQAITFMAADGQYAVTLPTNMTIIKSHAVKQDMAVIGDGSRYFFGGATTKQGKVDFSDDYKFIEDQRFYKIKFLGNGCPKDDNSFRYLNIADLKSAAFKTETVTATVPSKELKSLKVGKLALSPTFNGSTTTEYTATATEAKNKITAVPVDAEADVTVIVNDTVIGNNTIVEWKPSEANVVKVLVEEGKTYTVTVTGPSLG